MFGLQISARKKLNLELSLTNFVLLEPSFHFAIRLGFHIGAEVNHLEAQGQSPVLMKSARVCACGRACVRAL